MSDERCWAPFLRSTQDRTLARGKRVVAYRELDKRQIGFRPHVWLSEEWFSPDGVPGIAVPFYLAHPRLERLERRMMRNVEGGSAESAMRILRHEAGHAIDTAYRLRRRKRWREIFGPASLPHPDTTAHARAAAASSISASGMRRRIPARISPRLSPCGSNRTPPGAAPMRNGRLSTSSNLSMSCWRTCVGRGRRCAIAKWWSRCARTRTRWPTTIAASCVATACTGARHDHLLERVFTAERLRRAPRASTFLRAHSLHLVNATMRELHEERYSVEQILRIVVERAEKLGLWMRGSRRDALRHARWMLVYLTRLYAQGESPRLSL